jgi:hypothetical protein
MMENIKMIKVTSLIPFCGFYDSTISNYLEAQEENENEWASEDNDRSAIVEVDWEEVFDATAKLYTAWFNDYLNDNLEELNIKLKLTLEFEDVISPKFYNFKTDKIDVSMNLDEASKMLQFIKEHKTLFELFEETCKEVFTSYDGFISFYDSDYKEWGDCSTWESPQWYAVILTLVIFIERYDSTSIPLEDLFVEDYYEELNEIIYKHSKFSDDSDYIDELIQQALELVDTDLEPQRLEALKDLYDKYPIDLGRASVFMLDKEFEKELQNFINSRTAQQIINGTSLYLIEEIQDHKNQLKLDI